MFKASNDGKTLLCETGVPLLASWQMKSENAKAGTGKTPLCIELHDLFKPFLKLPTSFCVCWIVSKRHLSRCFNRLRTWIALIWERPDARWRLGKFSLSICKDYIFILPLPQNAFWPENRLSRSLPQNVLYQALSKIFTSWTREEIPVHHR